MKVTGGPSFSEELVFRGLPKLIFEPFDTHRVRAIAYVSASSVAFGLLHASYGIGAVAATTYFGFVAALLLLWTNNLWYPLIGHFLTDLLVIWWRYEKFGTLPL